MKSIVKVAAIAAILATSSASAFWGNGNGSQNGTANGTGHGAGTGAGEAEFSFSFSGKGKGNMDAKTDVAGNGASQGASYNGYAPYYSAPVAPVKK